MWLVATIMDRKALTLYRCPHKHKAALKKQVAAHMQYETNSEVKRHAKAIPDSAWTHLHIYIHSTKNTQE